MRNAAPRQQASRPDTCWARRALTSYYCNAFRGPPCPIARAGQTQDVVGRFESDLIGTQRSAQRNPARQCGPPLAGPTGSLTLSARQPISPADTIGCIAPHVDRSCHTPHHRTRPARGVDARHARCLHTRHAMATLDMLAMATLDNALTSVDLRQRPRPYLRQHPRCDHWSTPSALPSTTPWPHLEQRPRCDIGQSTRHGIGRFPRPEL